jgi:hypothetical protein
LARKVVLNVLSSPPVVATLLGLLCNFLFASSPPPYITQPLTLLGNAFSALALLSLGASMVGKLKVLRGRNLLKALLLIALKSLLMPVVASVVLAALGQDAFVASDGQTYRTSLFAFVYGTFPTAPGAFAFSVAYAVDTALVGATIVLSNLLAAPLMFTTAKMAAISLDRHNDVQYLDLIYTASTDVGYASGISALLLLLILLANKAQTTARGARLLLWTVRCIVGKGASAEYERLGSGPP